MCKDEEREARGKRKELEEGGVEEEEERRGGVEDVDGADGAVGGVLFAEDEGFAVEIGDEAVGGPGLAIGEDAEVGVVSTGGFDEVGGEVGVELRRAGVEGG